MIWVVGTDDVILAEITSHLNFYKNNRLFGVIAKCIMRAKRDVDRLAWVRCVALELVNRKLFVTIES